MYEERRKSFYYWIECIYTEGNTFKISFWDCLAGIAIVFLYLLRLLRCWREKTSWFGISEQVDRLYQHRSLGQVFSHMQAFWKQVISGGFLNFSLALYWHTSFFLCWFIAYLAIVFYRSFDGVTTIFIFDPIEGGHANSTCSWLEQKIFSPDFWQICSLQEAIWKIEQAAHDTAVNYPILPFVCKKRVIQPSIFANLQHTPDIFIV